ncbi:hypothetical protein CK203_005310 [Vitis vinifera]|uniref:Uncharacterized protein n=1 Tax=Vitis vinifera TaxID=29760 RepID=A0A438KFB3_VITVI|nr:hypothetical protein CK203_005310 [Vitis vinifera]
MAPKKTVSSVRVSEAGEKAIDKLNAKEFRERFRIPMTNNSTRGSGSLCQLVQGIPPLLSDSTHLHSSQPCPGADGMQHYQHACVRSPALPSNGDRTARFDKGRGEGAGGSLGWMGGAIAASVEAFFSELYLKNSGFGIEGPPCGLGGKGVLACVCKLFEIDPKERAYKTLLSARNLRGRPGAPGICYQYSSRKLAKDEIVPGEHYTVKELPLYQEAKEADAERRRKLLEDRDQKKTEGTIRKAPGQKRGPDSPPKKTSGKRGSWSFLGRAARLANVAEEAASINRPGNLNPDADAAETAPLEEAGQKAKVSLPTTRIAWHSPGERASSRSRV